MKSGPIVGTEVAGYRIEGVVGRGGMSIVFLAEHLRLGRKVALKVLAPELVEDESFRKRFVRESRLAASLDHPNVIPIFDAGEDAGLLYIAMRYVDGTDLRELIEEQGSLQPRRAHGIVAQVAGALDAAHSRGLIHRDVKPGNVLIDPEFDTNQINHVYLTDFGLVKQTVSNPSLTKTGQFVGTIPYVSPEQIKGKTVDHRADIYSLGCVLFECLTGQQPYPRDDDVAVMWAHVNDDPPQASSLRPELARGIDEVIRKAMAKSPEMRYQTCREFAMAASRALRVSGDFEVLLEQVTPAEGAPIAPPPVPSGSETVPAANALPTQETEGAAAAPDGATTLPEGSVGEPSPPLDTLSTIGDSTDGVTTTLQESGQPSSGTIADATFAAATVTSDAGDAATVLKDAPSAADTVADEDVIAGTTAPSVGPAPPEAPAAPSPPQPRERPRRVVLIVAVIVALLLIGGAAIAFPILTGDEAGPISPSTGKTDEAIEPVIDAFGPTSGPVGTEVIITGTGFTGLTGVEFNGEPATFDVVDDSKVSATVPEGATTGRISIVTASGTRVSRRDFAVIEPIGAPRGLVDSFVGPEVVRLEWRVPRDGSLLHYIVLRDNDRIATTTKEVFRDTDVVPGTRYVYVIVPVGEDGSRARSDALNVTVPTPPTEVAPPSDTGSASGCPPGYLELPSGECIPP